VVIKSFLETKMKAKLAEKKLASFLVRQPSQPMLPLTERRRATLLTSGAYVGTNRCCGLELGRLRAKGIQHQDTAATPLRRTGTQHTSVSLASGKTHSH
jgi:hypothetical protein